ncbi:MAG: hypothetical protein O2856_02095 [Planctomycetota bacterium]|nr:hypothetical protein [Planctomycetota bacterium]
MPEVARSTASSAAETSGSAANALTRAYQQKRESASAPLISAKDAKAAEQHTLLMDFIKKTAIPGVLVVGTLLYAYIWWMNKVDYVGPPLYQVTGQVLKGGLPAPGINITFEPVGKGMDDLRHSATAVSDANGNFRLMYGGFVFYGAPAGEYRIGLRDDISREIAQSEALIFTVKENGKNEFKINL